MAALRDAKEEGIDALNRFCCIDRVSSDDRRPKDEGIVLTKLFSLTVNSRRPVILPIVDGSVPCSLLVPS